MSNVNDNIIKYSRDTRSPIPRSEVSSRVMSANKAKNTSPELILRRALWGADLRGYRIHSNGVVGKPDVVFRRRGIAIFVDGCFWHGCKKHSSIPKTNAQFWEEKISRNIERDKKVNKELKRSGWKVVRVWEHEIKKDPLKVVERIEVFMV